MTRFRFALASVFFASALVSAADDESDADYGGGVEAQAAVWLKGDLHVHSRHSADSSNHSIASILAFADTVGMDFLLISDHDNHVDGAIAQNTWADPHFRSETILLLYGAEWTTHRGHANPMSAKPYDHQRLYNARDDRDVRIASIKQELGVHLSVNHPTNDDAFSMTYDMIDSIEVWNSVLSSRNTGALLVWDDLLKSGRMMTGRGGSDAHHGQVANTDMMNDREREATVNNIGTPTTWVLAEARSRAGVIKALNDGRVSISANPHAPRLEFSADLDADGSADVLMGDNVEWTGGNVQFEVELLGGTLGDEPLQVKIIKNGSEFQSLEMKKAQRLKFKDTPKIGDRTYYRVEVYGTVPSYPEVPNAALFAGDLVALSNPIYFNFESDF